MKSLSRDSIQRMIGDRVGGGAGGNGGSGSLAGYATESWVSQNFLTIAFFGRLFKAYGPAETQGDPDVEVLPNDEETVISNIKAMFGFWTEQYLSALGQGSGGGGGGATALADLVDVLLNSPATGQILKYNGTKWVNADMPQSIDMNAVWSALANGSTNQQIAASHLSDAFATIFTAFTNLNNDKVRLTIGGVTKDLIIAYATNSNHANTAPWSGITDVVEGGNTVNEINFCDTTPTNRRLWINYQKRGQAGSLADTIQEYKIGNGAGSVDGVTVYVGNLYASGYVTALSDIRLKDVLGRFTLSAEAIAQASIIQFEWKDKRDERKHVGGIAQEWQEILPDAVVEDSDGRMLMDYGTIAYVSAVSLAKKVVSQQKEIDALKAENASLEKRLARLERMFALTGEEE